jgi:sarcosine oxidase subunit beta
VANKQYDAIIIGAGIIGACTAYELAKKGYKTLSVDTLPTSGYGSTSNSCAIVRAHYSTEDGVATAYEGFYYWDNWMEYLGVEDPTGMAEFRKTGSILLKSDGHDWRKVQAPLRRGWAWSTMEWTMQEMQQHIHIYSRRQILATQPPGGR